MKNGFIEIHRGGKRPRIYTKTYQSADIQKVNGEYRVVRIDRTKPLSTLEFTENQYSNDNAKKDFEKIKFCVISNCKAQKSLRDLFLFSLDYKFS